MYKIEIISNQFIITDTKKNEEQIRTAAYNVKFNIYNKSAIAPEYPIIKFGAVIGELEDGIKTINYSLNELVDSTDTPYTDISDFISKVGPLVAFKHASVSGATERLAESESSAATQNPTGLGTANAIQIEFGTDAVGTPSDPVQVLANGDIKFNQDIHVRIKLAFQFGRSGSPGTSLLLFRVTGGGIQLGRSVGFSSSDQDETEYFENDTWITATAGTIIKAEIMRDAAGVDFGGLKAVVPTVDGGNEWNNVPSASIRIIRII